MALSGENQGLALEWLARGFAGQLEVFELVALERAVEAQLAFNLAACTQHWLVGAEEGAELDWDAGAFADGAGFQLDILDGELLTFLRVAVVDARVAQGQAVDIQLDRLAGRFVTRLARWRFFARRRLAGRLLWRTGLGRAADSFPVAVAFVVTLQVEVEAVDADVAHLHFLAQQRHHADGKADHAQVGERFVRGLGAGQGGVGQLQAQPGEQAPADVAPELQLEVGLVAGDLADLVLVVVGIEQMSQSEQQRHYDQQQAEKEKAQNLA